MKKEVTAEEERSFELSEAFHKKITEQLIAHMTECGDELIPVEFAIKTVEYVFADLLSKMYTAAKHAEEPGWLEKKIETFRVSTGVLCAKILEKKDQSEKKEVEG